MFKVYGLSFLTLTLGSSVQPQAMLALKELQLGLRFGAFFPLAWLRDRPLARLYKGNEESCTRRT